MYTHKRLFILLIVVALGILLMLVSTKVQDDRLTTAGVSNPTDTQLSAINSGENNTASNTDPVAWLLQINGAIGPATSDYVIRNLTAATLANVQVVVLTMDTPGGLDTSMREIIRAILDSPIPVVGFVSPPGSRAASAGTYILYASHIAAMSPATNLGAATPVQIPLGIDLPEPKKPSDNDTGIDQADQNPTNALEKKMTNDAAAYIRSLAELRGRNIEWAELAVRQASSLSAHEALEKNVIDLVAEDVATLLNEIDGWQLILQGKTIELETDSIVIVEIVPDWRYRFLGVITNPNIAYILMLIGIYGLFLEFYNPGGIIPGVAGAICLLLALYAFQVLPISYAGLGLIGLGILLMIMEAFVPSTGILGIGGVIAFVLGSVILMDTESEAFQIALPLIFAVALFSAGVLILLVGMIMRSRHSALVSGDSAMIGENAEVMEDFTEQGLVRVHGELWQAVSEKSVHKGQFLPIKAIKGMKLWLLNNDVETGDKP
jgi:membrane-bound serine protease (ClpP class)